MSTGGRPRDLRCQPPSASAGMVPGLPFIRPPTPAGKQLVAVAIAFQDDGGAYAARLQKFANRECDAIVLPVSPICNTAPPTSFRVIVAAIASRRRRYRWAY
jgi:hypothetical protein